jgi:hypothetical protein
MYGMAHSLLISGRRLAVVLTVALAALAGGLIGGHLAGLPTLQLKPLFASIGGGAAFGAFILSGLAASGLGIADWWPRRPTMAESRRIFSAALDLAIKARDAER